MFILGIVLEITSIFFILYWLKKSLRFGLHNLHIAAAAKNDLLQLMGERLQYVQELNIKLANSIETESALYEITKELSKSVEESDILDAFQKKISALCGLSECSFADTEPLENNSNEYSIFKVNAASQKIKYFLIHDFGKADRDKITVMLNQLGLFLKRSRLYSEIQELSITDSLTGTYVRRYFLQRFKEELMRSERNGLALSFLLIDVDNFKAYNDTYGHLAGDAVLKEVAQLMKSSLRQIDMCARYGGEEFCLMLPETAKENAYVAAERIRANVESAIVKVYNESLNCTISVGASSYPKDGEQLNLLIDKADKALYKAKAQGKNRVCMAGMNCR